MAGAVDRICASCTGADLSTTISSSSSGEDGGGGGGGGGEAGERSKKNPHRKVLSAEGRNIGYALWDGVAEEEHRKTAIVWFYPLSGGSLVVEKAAESFSQRGYRSSVICVDRPGFGDTDPLLSPPPQPPAQDDAGEETAAGQFDWRIKGHARDVLRVLHHHRIEHAHLLGVCLGHPYAVQVARELLASVDGGGGGSSSSGNEEAENEASSSAPAPATRLAGMALVAPFVSTACPHSWRVARFGSRVPGFILRAGTSALTSIGDMLIPSLLTPDRLEQLVARSYSPSSSAGIGEDGDGGDDDDVDAAIVAAVAAASGPGSEGGPSSPWTDSDYEQAVDTIVKSGQRIKHGAKAIEAQLGSDPSWQYSVCDKFAVEAGLSGGGDDDYDGKKRESAAASSSAGPAYPSASRVPRIDIYTCPDDRVAPYQSVEWAARRCYGYRGKDDDDDAAGAATAAGISVGSGSGSKNAPAAHVHVLRHIHSHEMMIMMCGPPRNPILLHEIAKKWGLLR